MKESETAHSDGPDSCYAKSFTIESEGGKSEVFYNCQEPPGKHGEQDRERFLNQSVSFADWKLVLSESKLPPKERESFKITINWFLSFCKRSRSRATRRAANAFYETVRRERDPKPFQLVQWKNALAWFFRNAPEPSLDEEIIPTEQVHAEHSFYEQALGKVLGDFSDFLRARPQASTPTVLTAEELVSLFSKMARPYTTSQQN